MYNDYDYNYSYLDEDDYNDDNEVVEYSNYNDSPENYEDDYDDDYSNQNSDFPYRNKIIIGIIILMAIFLLIWLLPQILKSNKKKKTNETISINETIKIVKNKALMYFKEDNIPIEVNQEEKITLQNFKKENSLKNINSKNFVLTKSYIKITKKENDYLLKIKLVTKTSSKEKTYHINNYSYCTTTFLCEEQEIMDANEIEEESNDEEIQVTDTANEETSNSDAITNSKSTKNYLYEYSKTVDGQMSNWSLWKSYERTDCSTPSFTCNNNDFNCLEEVKLYNRKEQIGTHSVPYQANRDAYINTGVETKTGCLNNDYVKINGAYYKTTTTGKFSSIGTLSKNSPHSLNNWTYKGRSSFMTPPSDNLTTRYVFVSSEEKCSNCGSTPYYTYDIYSYTAELSNTNKLTANCSNLAYKTVPSYSITSQTINVSREEPIYGTVCYKSNRTRKITNKGVTTKKWSKYNDKNLLNSNYTYTGNKKEK